jgi:hypothetical protein
MIPFLPGYLNTYADGQTLLDDLHSNSFPNFPSFSKGGEGLSFVVHLQPTADNSR